MKTAIIRTWAVAQIILGIAIVASTAHYAPPVFGKMREEACRTGTNLVEIAEAVTAARATYAESATNLFATGHELEDIEAKLQDAGAKIGDVGHTFEKRGRKFGRAERHNRESKVFWGKVETPFNDSIANVYGDLKEWTLAASTNLCDVGRDLSHVSKAVGKQRKAIAKFQKDGHPKTLQAMEASAQTIGHVGEMLLEAPMIDAMRRFTYILCGIIALLFIGNGIVLLVASSTPRLIPPSV